jgi:hypothetical protein
LAAIIFSAVTPAGGVLRIPQRVVYLYSAE